MPGLQRHGEAKGHAVSADSPAPEPTVPFIHLRCPAHRGRRRRRGYKGFRPSAACPDCRTVWAPGEGPEAAREREAHGEAVMPERRETLPPL